MRVITEEAGEGTAITYDASATGLLIACPGKLEVGTLVQLRFRVTGEEPERSVAGRVVRLDPPEEGDDGPWRYRMAVAFDEPQPGLEGALRVEAEDEAEDEA